MFKRSLITITFVIAASPLAHAITIRDLMPAAPEALNALARHKTALVATASAAAGATVALVGKQYYDRYINWLFKKQQDYAAQACALAANLQTGTAYTITVNLDNKDAPIAIQQVAQPAPAQHLLTAHIPAAVVVHAPPAAAPVAQEAVRQAAAPLTRSQRAQEQLTKLAQVAVTQCVRAACHFSPQRCLVGCKTLINHPVVLIASASSIATAIHLFRHPALSKTVKGMGLGSALLIAGILFKEKFIQELRRTQHAARTQKAIQEILTNARGQKTPQDTNMYTLTLNADGTYSLIRHQQLVLTHANVAALVPLQQQRPAVVAAAAARASNART